MPSHALVLFFEWVSLLGAGLTALKLFSSGLYRRYRFFFVYLVSLVPYGICLLVLDVHSGLYQKFWTVTTPLFWLLYVLVVFELCGLILERHKGLYTLGRWAMYLGPCRGCDCFRVEPSSAHHARHTTTVEDHGLYPGNGAWSGFQPGHLYSVDSIILEPIPRAVEPECGGTLGGVLAVFPQQYARDSSLQRLRPACQR